MRNAIVALDLFRGPPARRQWFFESEERRILYQHRGDADEALRAINQHRFENQVPLIQHLGELSCGFFWWERKHPNDLGI